MASGAGPTLGSLGFLSAPRREETRLFAVEVSNAQVGSTAIHILVPHIFKNHFQARSSTFGDIAQALFHEWKARRMHAVSTSSQTNPYRETGEPKFLHGTCRHNNHENEAKKPHVPSQLCRRTIPRGRLLTAGFRVGVWQRHFANPFLGTTDLARWAAAVPSASSISSLPRNWMGSTDGQVSSQIFTNCSRRNFRRARNSTPSASISPKRK